MFRYANGGGTDRPLDLAVNGSSTGTEPFAPTAGWTDWTDWTAVVTLHAGANTVRATAAFAPGERATTVHGYSRQPVRVPALGGAVTAVTRDPGTHLFSFHLHSTGASSASFLIQPDR
jgi:hypothetical protein